jgi:hypothetical protein
MNLGVFDSPFVQANKGWSSSRKYASVMAAGASFFVDSCNAERVLMDGELMDGSHDSQYRVAVATQTCLFDAYASATTPREPPFAKPLCDWLCASAECPSI